MINFFKNKKKDKKESSFESNQKTEEGKSNLTIADNKKIKKTRFGWQKIFNFKEFNEDFYEELEETLLLADFGGQNTITIIEEFKDKIKTENIKSKEDAILALQNIIKTYFLEAPLLLNDNKLDVLCIIGINGVGKTTTIAKLGHFFKSQNKDTIFGAADNFRAAAVQQLEEWGEKVGIPVIGNREGTDSAASAYDTVHSALAQKKDIAIIDTAGRLHTKKSLVDQLGKLIRVVDKFSEQIQRKNILVLDATLGQNGYEQAKVFKEVVGIDGLILTKLDTQSKGGVVVNISKEIGVPVYFTCHGEKMEEMSVFNIEEYVKSLF